MSPMGNPTKRADSCILPQMKLLSVPSDAATYRMALLELSQEATGTSVPSPEKKLPIAHG